jgi:hypothetical protein
MGGENTKRPYLVMGHWKCEVLSKCTYAIVSAVAGLYASESEDQDEL